MKFEIGQKIIAISEPPYNHFSGLIEKPTKFIEIEIIIKKENVQCIINIIG